MHVTEQAAQHDRRGPDMERRLVDVDGAEVMVLRNRYDRDARGMG